MFKKILALVIAFSGIGGCGSAEDPMLDATFTGKNNIYIIPAKAMSCFMLFSPAIDQTNDVSESYFQIKNFTLTWKGIDSDFFITLIKIKVDFPFGTETWFIGGQELASLNGTQGRWDGIIERESDPFVAKCPLTLGGLSIGDQNDKVFQASGTVTIKGFERDDEGNEKPITIVQYIQVKNDP